MHFWIDKRSPYGFGRARVSGAGSAYGQYPRRLRPSKPWSQTHRSTASSTSSTPNDGNGIADHHQGETLPHIDEPSDDSASYFKWFLWAIAIALSTFLVYIICDNLYHVYLLFTFCALLAIFFLLGVCTISNLFRRTAAQPPLAATSPPEISLPQQPLESNSRHQQHPEHQHQHHHHHHHHQHHRQAAHRHQAPQEMMHTHESSPTISIHNLAESPTPTYHHSHNQVSHLNMWIFWVFKRKKCC